MLETIIAPIAAWVKDVISATGYVGVALLMAIESANVPLPSEIIMPFAGFLVWEGEFSMWPVVFAGAVGNLLGSLASYAIGYYGGRPFLEKYGRWLFIKEHELAVADRFFNRYGEATVFFTRNLPIIRTFISLPAGISRMNLWRFSVLSFIGCIPWCWLLTFAGFKAGENWDKLGKYFHFADYIVAAVLVGLIVYWAVKIRGRGKPEQS
ncbi:MAG: DedA family protein [bacterium]|jgi:membrane protein DedA with SNARE-associated domain